MSEDRSNIMRMSRYGYKIMYAIMGEIYLLVSCIIHLGTKDEALVPPAMGQVLHAFFLDKVRDIDSGLAEELHRQVFH